jgi:hypothetical protein
MTLIVIKLITGYYKPNRKFPIIPFPNSLFHRKLPFLKTPHYYYTLLVVGKMMSIHLWSISDLAPKLCKSTLLLSPSSVFASGAFRYLEMSTLDTDTSQTLQYSLYKPPSSLATPAYSLLRLTALHPHASYYTDETLAT